jgi:outer membrane receptor protein involved in Fe transport
MIHHARISRAVASASSALAFFLTAALPSEGLAQTSATADQTAPAAPTPTQVNAGGSAGAEPVTALPPFEVQSSSKDIGYYTQNTTMGTRLNSNLGDLGASITVISKQQMTDTASVNINDLFLYEASTEGTENYTSLGGFGKGAGIGDNIQASPQTSNRVRGLGNVDITRDYFLTNPAIQVDTYNIDDAELSRGPNSTLFGIGSPSGILNLSIEKAVLNKDTNEVSARYGSFGDFRSTLNLNRALIPDKLAIAVAGLYSNQHPTGQEPEYDIERREFAAITLKPFAGTTVRANIEFYDNPNRVANSITPADEVTPWLANGSPKWDPITYTATVNGVTSAPITNNLLLPAGLISGLGNAGVGFPQFYIVHGVAQLWEQAQLGTNFASPGSPTNAVGSVNGTGTNAATNIWGPIGEEREVYTAGNYAKFASSAPAGQLTYPLFHEPGISNPQLLNYQGINLLAPNLGEDKATTYHVEVEQEITENLFLDAGWYREQFTTIQHNYMGGNVGNAVLIDPNTRFLNGSPNPYFGEPFTVVQQPADNTDQDLNEQERLSLVYQLDFTKNNNWTKWLGHHTVQAFYQHQEEDTSVSSWRLEVLDAHSWNSTTDIGGPSSSLTDSLTERYYLSNGGAGISYDDGAFVNTNFTFPVTWYNTQLNGGTWTNESTKLGQALVPVSTNKTQEQVWSYAGSLQDYLLNDRLVLTLGQRHDYERSRVTDGLTVDPTTGLTDVDNLSQFSNWNYADGITRQAGGVLHLTKWLSAHYNQSDNFQVTSLGEDEFGNVLPNPSGTGKDYGVSVSLWDDKLVAEINWYKSNAANSREGTTTYVQRALRTDYGGFVPWAQQIATNNLGTGASATAINAYAQTIIQFPTGLQGLANATQFASDTETVQAQGWEFNLIYNPTRNWTMKLTADQDRAVDSNVYPHVQAYIASRLAVWTKATDPVLGPFWTTVSADKAFGGQYSISSAGTPQQWLNGTVDAAGLDVEIAQQGHDQPDLSRYHFNYLTNYQVVTGPWAGFGVGTALRYETPSAIGYLGGAPDPAALGAIDTLQALNPVDGKEVLHQDLWISYKFRLPWLDRRIRATVQLNCRDVWSQGYLETVGINPDGSPQAFRIIPPRQWYLQTTFDF